MYSLLFPEVNQLLLVYNNLNRALIPSPLVHLIFTAFRNSGLYRLQVCSSVDCNNKHSGHSRASEPGAGTQGQRQKKDPSCRC